MFFLYFLRWNCIFFPLNLFLTRIKLILDKNLFFNSLLGQITYIKTIQYHTDLNNTVHINKNKKLPFKI